MLRQLMKEPSHFLVKYLCDDKLQLRRKGHFRSMDEVQISFLYEVQWGRYSDVDTARVIAAGNEKEMRERLKEEQTNQAMGISASASQSPPASPPSSPTSSPQATPLPPMPPSPPSPPTPPAPKRRAVMQKKVSDITAATAHTISRGKPPSSPSETGSPISTPSSQTPTPIESTSSETPHLPGYLSRRPNQLDLRPSPPPSPGQNVVLKEILSIVKTISKKVDTMSTRVTSVEKRCSTIEGKVDNLYAIIQEANVQSQHTEAMPEQCDEGMDPFQSIPERHRLEKGELDRMMSSSSGPGNFGKKLVQKLFPDLFGPDNLRFLYSYNGGGPKEKRALDPVRKHVISTYVQHYFPVTSSTSMYVKLVVNAINEGLRRPVEKKNRIVARVSTSEANYYDNTDHDSDVFMRYINL